MLNRIIDSILRLLGFRPTTLPSTDDLKEVAMKQALSIRAPKPKRQRQPDVPDKDMPKHIRKMIRVLVKKHYDAPDSLYLVHAHDLFSSVWRGDYKERFDACAAKAMPILADLGLRPKREPGYIVVYKEHLVAFLETAKRAQVVPVPAITMGGPYR